MDVSSSTFGWNVTAKSPDELRPIADVQRTVTAFICGAGKETALAPYNVALSCLLSLLNAANGAPFKHEPVHSWDDGLRKMELDVCKLLRQLDAERFRAVQLALHMAIESVT